LAPGRPSARAEMSVQEVEDLRMAAIHLARQFQDGEGIPALARGRSMTLAQLHKEFMTEAPRRFHRASGSERRDRGGRWWPLCCRGWSGERRPVRPGRGYRRALSGAHVQSTVLSPPKRADSNDRMPVRQTVSLRCLS